MKCSLFLLATKIVLLILGILLVKASFDVEQARKEFLCEDACVSALEHREYGVVLGMAKLPGIKRSPMEDRADLAAKVFHAHKVDFLIAAGGKGTSTQPSEAEALRAMLEVRGVPHERIFIEPQSRTTIENIQNVQKLIRDREHDTRDYSPSVYLITHTLHAYRADSISQKYRLSSRVLGVEPKDPKIFLHIGTLRESLATVMWWAKRGLNWSLY